MGALEVRPAEPGPLPAGRAERRIGVFGGSFNPPHLGHEALVRILLDRGLVDEVWILPVFEHPFGKPLAPFEDRLEMCRLAFATLPPAVHLSALERDLGGPSFTVRTLEELRRTVPAAERLLIVGADNLKDQESWKDFPRVRELARLLVVPRRGEPSPEALAIPAPPDVSSREVRRRLAAGEPVAELVHPEVESYIRRRSLYRAPTTEQGRGDQR